MGGFHRATGFSIFPLQLGPRRLSHRIVMAPLTRMRATTGNVPGELNASYKSPPKTNSMTRVRRSKKLLTISLSVHFHFLQAKISLNKVLQLLATHVIYLVYIVNNDLRGTNPYRRKRNPPKTFVASACFQSLKLLPLLFLLLSN